MKKWYSWYSKPRERLWKILPMKFLNFTFKQWNGRYFHVAGVLYFTPEIHEKFVSEEKNEEWPETRNRIIARASPNFCRYDFSFFLSFLFSLSFFSCLLPRRGFRFHSGFKISLRDLEANVPQFHLPLDDLDALYKFMRLNFLSEHSRKHRVIGKNRS